MMVYFRFSFQTCLTLKFFSSKFNIFWVNHLISKQTVKMAVKGPNAKNDIIKCIFKIIFTKVQNPKLIHDYKNWATY